MFFLSVQIQIVAKATYYAVSRRGDLTWRGFPPVLVPTWSEQETRAAVSRAQAQEASYRQQMENAKASAKQERTCFADRPCTRARATVVRMT